MAVSHPDATLTTLGRRTPRPWTQLSYLDTTLGERLLDVPPGLSFQPPSRDISPVASVYKGGGPGLGRWGASASAGRLWRWGRAGGCGAAAVPRSSAVWTGPGLGHRSPLHPIGLDDVVPFALDTLGSPARGIRLQVPDDLPAAHADPALFEHIVANLASNALCHSPSD